jgi:guanylate kinase
MEGKLIIFSAPSGSGKTTIVKHLISKFPNLGFSISACTRDRRGRNEENGKDYYFLTPEEFKQKIDEQAFAEWEEVYPGGFYGTLKSEIERQWAQGKHVIFDVDVKGGVNLKKAYGDKAMSIFVKVPSIEELERRLRERGTESEEKLSARVFKMKFEMSFQDQFDHVLLNEDLNTALAEAEVLVSQFINS